MVAYKKYLLAVAILLLMGSLLLAIKRDTKNLADGYACDLRKRIVGSRYQALGYSPYFFKWQPGYPETLANPYEVGPALPQNSTTLAPSYLWLLQPLAQLTFPTIEKVWLVLQYVFLFLIALLFYQWATHWQQRLLCILITGATLFTAGWVGNADIGQSYLLFPLIWAAGYAMGSYTQKPWFWAAVALAISCWLRPVCGLLILPFLFMPQRRYFLKVFILAAVVLIAQVLLTGQWQNWVDFFKSSVLWGKYYATWGANAYSAVGNDAMPGVIEGQSDFSITPLPDYMANLPMVVQALFGKPLLSAMGYTLLLVISIAFLIRRLWLQMPTLSLEKRWMGGFLLYYSLEFFAVIPKPSYYCLELLFPIYLLVTCWQQLKWMPRFLLVAGTLLALLPSDIIPMHLLLGEYMIVAATMVYWFANRELLTAPTAKNA
jgi:Glycosyltransferase family 87